MREAVIGPLSLVEVKSDCIIQHIYKVLLAYYVPSMNHRELNFFYFAIINKKKCSTIVSAQHAHSCTCHENEPNHVLKVSVMKYQSCRM